MRKFTILVAALAALSVLACEGKPIASGVGVASAAPGTTGGVVVYSPGTSGGVTVYGSPAPSSGGIIVYTPTPGVTTAPVTTPAPFNAAPPPTDGSGPFKLYIKDPTTATTLNIENFAQSRWDFKGNKGRASDILDKVGLGVYKITTIGDEKDGHGWKASRSKVDTAANGSRPYSSFNLAISAVQDPSISHYWCVVIKDPTTPDAPTEDPLQNPAILAWVDMTDLYTTLKLADPTFAEKLLPGGRTTFYSPNGRFANF